MQNSIIPINKIEINESIYPREQVSDSLIREFVIDMKKGDSFPPLYLGLYKEKKVLIDGRHRLEALKLLGEQFINCEIKKFVSIDDMLLTSVRTNLKHGKRLTRDDKLKIIRTMKDMKFEIDGISKLTGFSQKNIERTGRLQILKSRIGIGGSVIRDKIKTKENIKLIDKEEIEKLEIKNKLNWQIEELQNIYDYFKKTEIFIDNKKVYNHIKNIKHTLKKEFPKI